MTRPSSAPQVPGVEVVGEYLEGDEQVLPDGSPSLPRRTS